MLYNLGIYFYGFLVILASAWNKKAKKWRKGRIDWKSKLPSIPKDKKVVWFHCASMGEYDQGLPVMQKILEKDSSVFLLVTFFSPSGYEFLKDKSIGHHTCYLPLDTPSSAKHFVDHFKPVKVFFVKYEFWLNYIDACKSQGSSIYGLSTVFRSDQRFFKWYGGRFKDMISKFSHFFVQDNTSAEILRKNGYDQYTITGDTRYDRVIARTENDHSNPILNRFSNSFSKILVVGSSWPKDEALLIPLINSGELKAGVILAPHEVHFEHIESIAASLKVPFQKYTELENGEELKQDTQVIILNCIGILANAYKYGSLAYVGGAFGTGLHNILEPAAFGLPVIYGPDYRKFPEASVFLKEGIGFSVSDQSSLSEVAKQLLKDETINEKVKSFINSQSGASDLVLERVYN